MYIALLVTNTTEKTIPDTVCAPDWQEMVASQYGQLAGRETGAESSSLVSCYYNQTNNHRHLLSLNRNSDLCVFSQVASKFLF